MPLGVSLAAPYFPICSRFLTFLSVAAGLLKTSFMTALHPLRIFKHPRGAVLGLSALGIINIALQAAFDWHVDFVASEVVLQIFACTSLFAGNFIVCSLSKSLLETSVAIQNTDLRRPSKAEILSGNLQTVILVFLGSAVGACSVYTQIQLGLPWSGLVLLVCVGTAFLNCSLVGIVLGLYCLALSALFDLSNAHLDVRPLNWQPQAMRRLANDYLSLIGIGVVLYLLACLAVWISPGGVWFLAHRGPIRNLWILPMAACVTGYFCLTQFLLHRITYKVKENRITYLREKQQMAFDKWEEGEDKLHAESVEFLGKLIEDVSKEGTWPFDLPKAATILLPVLIPATKQISAIFEVVFKG
jgi:hypothetical protein